MKAVFGAALACTVLAGFGYGQRDDFGTIASQRPQNQPNVIFILLDDAGYADLGSYGGTSIATPSLDLFASQGMRFTNAYSSGAVCSPTRAAFLSGLTPAESGFRLAFNSAVSYRGLPGYVTTVAETLRRAGYMTAHVGKWHLGLNRAESRPIAQGFTFTATHKSPIAFSTPYWDPVITINDALIFPHPGEHLTDVQTNYAINFIRAFAQEPFFLNLWYTAPHLPLEPTPEWAGRYPDTDEGRYAALLGHADEQIGRLLDELDQLGLDENTIVIIGSDNGGSKQTHTSNGTLRGFKREFFEGGIRVPLMFRWPGRIPEGTTNQSVVITSDLHPTIADLVGVPTPFGSDRSLAGTLMSGSLRARIEPLFWEEKPLSSRIVEGEGGRLYDYAVRLGLWKLVMERANVYLFNMSTDPEESSNQASAYPFIVDYLRGLYDVWRSRVSRLPVSVVSSSPAVNVTGESMYFNGAGTVDLDNDSQFDFHDGDFSFKLTVDPQIPPGQLNDPAEIMHKDGSWRLQLTRSGRARLRVIGTDRDTVLSGTTVLNPGPAVELAVTFYGLDEGDTLIRLYVNGVLEAEGGVAEVAPSPQSIVLGDTDPDRAFLGQIDNLELFNTALSSFEVTTFLNASPPAAPKKSGSGSGD